MEPEGVPRTLPSLLDVAALAGVSQGTVSNVLNHPERVATPTADRVRAAIESLGYSPNQNARALVSGRTRTIGLVVAGLTNTLYVDLTYAAQRAARANGHTLILGTSEDDSELQGEHLRFLDSARVAGVLLASLEDAAEQVERVRRHGRPVVFVNHEPATVDACAVVVDNHRVGVLALEHMIAIGRRRILFVTGRTQLQPVRRRHAGMLEVAADHPDVTFTEMDVDGITADLGVVAARRILAMPPEDRPDGIIGVTDGLALAIATVLRQASVDVPGDIAVMGCDHSADLWAEAVPLTSVTMRGADMGRTAVELLLAELDDDAGSHVHRTVVLEPTLLERESTSGRPDTL